MALVLVLVVEGRCVGGRSDDGREVEVEEGE